MKNHKQSLLIKALALLFVSEFIANKETLYFIYIYGWHWTAINGWEWFWDIISGALTVLGLIYLVRYIFYKEKINS
jgi:hypothetical protein